MNISKILVLCAAISISASAEVYAQNLSGSELKTLLTGKSFSYTGKWVGTEKFHRDGKMTYKLDSGYSDEGKWWIKGNRYCAQFPEGKAKCYTIRRLSNGLHKTSSGTILTPM